ncbi:response regulator [Deinococcus taeanensis]|uniref:response regulator n=1 Tax=Deinococcus taeanensis TaxID=2737050 RepID=UPI001CDC2742|nr:response regulator [Deinococcus taeanensis]UBV41664.1 response regulator [Deinococcus taeanensis]
MTVLVVDDHPAELLLTCEVFELTMPDVDVITAGSVPEALHILSEHQVLPDLILLDQQLLGQSGFEVLSAVRGTPRTQHIPVIMMSAQHQDAHETLARELGATAYLQKSVDLHEYMDSVTAFMEKVR